MLACNQSSSNLPSSFPFYFPAKKFFGRKNFSSVVGVIFLFLKLPLMRRFQVCRVVGVLYKIRVGYHQKPLSAISFTYFQTPVNTFLYFTCKKQGFSTKSSFFHKCAFLSEKIRFKTQLKQRVSF